MADPSSTILMIEDSPEDFEVMSRSMKNAGLANPVFWCEDGDQALDYLRQRGEYSDGTKYPRPCLILLDLNLPATSGHEVLAEIKTDDRLQDIPVVVLTSSDDPGDIEKCYQMGANSYMHKPVTFDGVMEAVQRLKEYWFQIVLLPKGQ